MNSLALGVSVNVQYSLKPIVQSKLRLSDYLVKVIVKCQLYTREHSTIFCGVLQTRLTASSGLVSGSTQAMNVLPCELLRDVL